MSRVIKIQPIENVFSLTWNLGARCNYDCMYCPSSLHNNYSEHVNFELLQTRWKNILEKTSYRNLKYKISFTGGEVTANPDFIGFLTWLHDHYDQLLFRILVTTNGSSTLAYYKKLFTLVDNISFSVHSEHINEQRFFYTVIELHHSLGQDKHLHVNIMDEPWNRHRIKLYTDLLNEQNISWSVNAIDFDFQTRSYPIMKGKLNLDIPQS